MTLDKDLFDTSARPSTVGTLVYLMFGPIVWAVHLTVVYGGHTLACNAGTTNGQTGWLVIMAAVVAECLIVPVAIYPGTARIFGVTEEASDRPAYQGIARWLAGLSAIAVIWSGSAILVIDACTQAR